MKQNSPSVSIQGLALSYGAISVLKEFDLDIAHGEFIVLLGPSGCGKSTLLNCIAGLLEPSAGKVFINGKNVTWDEPRDRGIGMVFQSYALYPQMTVERNLSFGLRVAGLPKEEINKRVARAAEMLQLEPLLQRKPTALSGGQPSALLSAAPLCVMSMCSCLMNRCQTWMQSSARSSALKSSVCTRSLATP
jgi:multiple sugar transport system ATP-binding protein